MSTVTDAEDEIKAIAWNDLVKARVREKELLTEIEQLRGIVEAVRQEADADRHAARDIAREAERLRTELDAADDLLSCAQAAENLEGATAEEWDEQMDAWRSRNGFGAETERELEGATALEIDCGDTVKHEPTGETWLVAHVDGDRLAWCGWPPGEAELADCTLVRKATAEERLRLLRRIADSRCRENGDRRQGIVRRRLEEMGHWPRDADGREVEA
ncbi:MAG: hypothetical protein KGL39_15420 [Patescibacteria group bacterium]|nr:hypothetical protein [Patescibacteria group bacterium]